MLEWLRKEPEECAALAAAVRGDPAARPAGKGIAEGDQKAA